LNARIFVGQSRRLIKAGLGGLFQHRLCRRLHGDQDADFGFLALDHAAQVADICCLHVFRFHRENDLLGLAAFFVVGIPCGGWAWSGVQGSFGGKKRPPQDDKGRGFGWVRAKSRFLPSVGMTSNGSKLKSKPRKGRKKNGKWFHGFKTQVKGSGQECPLHTETAAR